MRRVRACWPLLAGVVLLALGLARPVTAQSSPPPQRQVTVQNETELTLDDLYLFPSGAAERGPGRLADAGLAPGASFRATLGRQANCVFDVVAVWQDGREETRSAVNICRTPRLVFGDPALPTLDIAIANRSAAVLRELYASTDGAAGWGPDRLGSQVIAANGEFRLRLRRRECRFDLRAVYADEREEVKTALDLCTQRAVVFDRSTLPRLPSRTLVLANRHLATVQEVYVSPSTDGDWGPDRLGAATPLPVGEDATVTLDSACLADIRIVFPNGGAEERREVDLCTTQLVRLVPGWVLGPEFGLEPPPDPMADPDMAEPAPGDMTARPAASLQAGEPLPGDTVALKLRNAGTVPIIEIYAAPPGEPRGADRLGADVLGVGETLELEPPDGDACLADLVALFRDGREVRRAGVDLCHAGEIEIR